MEPIRPRTILFVHYPSDLYGASRSLLRLCSLIDRSKFTPVVILQKDGLLKPRLEDAGVEVVLIPRLCVIERSKMSPMGLLRLFGDFLVSAKEMFRLIKTHNALIVHTNTGIIVSPAFAAVLAGVPHVWHIRDWFGEFRGLWALFSRYIVGTSKRVICVSRPIAAQFPHSPRVIVKNNGFDVGEFDVPREELRAEFRNRWGIAKDEFVAGTVGRIKFVRKGQETLVSAIALLNQRGIHVKGLVVGSVFPGNEDHLDRLKALIASHALGSQILLVGELADPKPAYAAMDVFVLPSAQPEPFGGVVMEAMAMSLPVIGTAIGGTPEQIVEGETGMLFPPGDAAALAGRIGMLFQDRLKGVDMGSRGRERIRTTFDLRRFVRSMEDLYDGLQEKVAA
jgi:glycosyltransferase involved in cell wall biosynthesis